ncbi:MAG: ABC transporter ATP-binding protein [Clostridia bacterium]|nr:ABC transporter ATP-binding protein [Clostridia bacterium]
MGPMPKRPTDGIEKPKNIKGVPKYIGRVIGGFFGRLFYILSLVWEAKKSVLFILMLLCLLDGVLPVAGAFISAELLNKLGLALTGELPDFTPIVWLLVALFAYQFINKINSRISTMTTRIAGELVANHIRVKIITKAKDVDLASFDRPEFYEKLENANREAGHRPISILSASFSVISACISAVSFVVILATLHPAAPLLVLLMALPAAVINYVYRNKTFRYMRHRSKDRRQMDYYANVMVNKDLVKEIRLMDLSGSFIGKYKSVFAKYYAGIRRLILQEGFWHMAVALMTVIANAVVFVYVAYNVYAGTMELGDYSLYTGALGSILNYANTLVSSTATIYEGTLFIDNMMTFMREKPTVVSCLDEPRIPKRGKHTIEFCDVSFAYPGTDRMVLDHVNFRLESGETTVLVGLNGAGKTTLIKLLTRLYDPTEGKILLDGYDLREYDVRALYDLFGIIFQDFGKYAVSVAENIAFGDVHRKMQEEAIRAAAEESSAAAFIEQLPDGYNTPLMRYFEENGTELSIGQWQKLSIARAFYKDSDILILDEPTASLDPLAEQEVFDQFSRLGEEKITVFVSHRLSSATTAHQILVLEYGKIIECGSHAALMAENGRYRELFSTQARRYTEVQEEGQTEKTEC